ncbi:MAG TPA: hypothetical protein VIO14_12945 [Dehalococcoidia bacterium]
MTPRSAVLLCLLLALLAACSGDGAERPAPGAPPATPTASPPPDGPSPTPPPAATAPPAEGLLLLDGAVYVPVDGAPAPGALEPIPGSEASGAPVYRAVGAGAPWLRYTREGASYRAWTPRPVRLAVEDLAAGLGVRPEAVTVVAVEPVEWPNACLGVEEVATFCAQVITPGYRITLAAGGAEYVYHADRDARVIRARPRA